MMLVPDNSFSINAEPLQSEQSSRIVTPLHSFRHRTPRWTGNLGVVADLLRLLLSRRFRSPVAWRGEIPRRRRHVEALSMPSLCGKCAFRDVQQQRLSRPRTERHPGAKEDLVEDHLRIVPKDHAHALQDEELPG